MLGETSNASKCISVFISAKIGYPINIKSNGNLIKDIENKPLEEVLHAEDYPSFLEVLSEVLSGEEKVLSVHSRFVVGESYNWFYIKAGVVLSDGEVSGVSGFMFDVSEYLQYAPNDLVIREYNRRSIIKNNAVKYSQIPLVDIVEKQYLDNIQKTFLNFSGLYSAILDSDYNIISVGNREYKKVKPDKFKYSLQKVIRIEQQDAAYWTIASDNKALVDKYSNILDILSTTVSRLANSYVLVLKEIDNSRNTSKILGQSIEEQIFLKNIYSIILENENTNIVMEKLLKYSGEFFSLDRIAIYLKSGNDLIKGYCWSKCGADFGDYKLQPSSLQELSLILQEEEAYFSRDNFIQLPFSHKCTSYAAANLFGVGENIGLIFFEDFKNERKWFLRETKLIKTISQIFSTVVVRAMVEKRLAVSQQALKKQAFTDPITGLANRAKCERVLTKLLKNKSSGIVLAMEITNFRKTGELFGFSYAEMLLKSIADYIDFLPFENKRVFRYSENVFVIVLNDTTLQKGVEFANKLISKFKLPWYLDTNQHLIHTSIGISKYPYNGTSFDEVTNSAMLAMYRSKEYSNNSYTIYAKDFQLEASYSKELESRMKAAIENDFEGFYVVYQPVVDGLGNIKSCEAFVRWKDEKYGCVMTSVFIELAEYLGISDKIDTFVLDEACRASVDFMKIFGSDFTVSVNVTAHELQSKAIIKKVLALLEKYNLPPQNLVLEIPETAQANFINDTNACLTALRGIGVGITADSFGRDYLSLSALRNSFINMVKIDKDIFINESDEFSRILAHSIIELAHSRNIKVCVKGIEIEQEMEKINQFNCDLTQGYYISEPLSKEEMQDFNCDILNTKNVR